MNRTIELLREGMASREAELIDRYNKQFEHVSSCAKVSCQFRKEFLDDPIRKIFIKEIIHFLQHTTSQYDKEYPAMFT